MKLWQAEGEAKLKANRTGRPHCVWAAIYGADADGEYHVTPDVGQPGWKLVEVKMPDSIILATLD